MAENDRYRSRLRVVGNDNEEPPALKSSGGGGTYDDMEPRVIALEEGLKRIEGKIDTLVERTFEMKGQLSAMPSAVTFGDIRGALGKLEGRIDRLPTTAKVGALVGIIGGVVLILTKWLEIKTFFGI